MNWFESARLGMFIHWGHSSSRGWELSWPLVGGVFSLPYCQDVAIAEYHQNASNFKPTDYNPRLWASLAKRLGVEYVILTTKHHDGFSLFPTTTSDFCYGGGNSQQDLVKQFVEAMREAGLRVGFYFSLIDWHHPDYPAFTEADKPYRFDKIPQPTPQQWERFSEVMFEQIRELLTLYGRIDIIWFDGSWERTPSQWRSSELAQMIRQLQPDILINDRLPGQGDFATPEQFIPPKPPDGLWEVCLTINDSWGYNKADNNYKDARTLVHKLCEIAAKGGKLLLNVSPMGNGQIPPPQQECLESVAEWMSRYGESIIDTQPGLLPWQFYGPSTRKDNFYYLHLLMKPYETVSVRGIPIKQIESVKVVGSDRPLSYSGRCSIIDELTQNPQPLGELTITVPESAIDPLATVLVIQLAQA
ncbi:Alpha-L-fucosidase [Gloeothece citriformis PCC 7424]|uniref:alpha-L-fucosidase n=1 Tax=Gloeothece citriformis (strain PCC 7424) TaxID=65393 RepID=B7KFE4_GLOC7|nr:alpha-L-fucosidase [Gloeothece citriformis]ACK71860.1 Alpha-L-fucosidase [Gloeothece citriformis PCC 7424]